MCSGWSACPSVVRHVLSLKVPLPRSAARPCCSSLDWCGFAKSMRSSRRKPTSTQWRSSGNPQEQQIGVLQSIVETLSIEEYSLRVRRDGVARVTADTADLHYLVGRKPSSVDRLALWIFQIIGCAELSVTARRHHAELTPTLADKPKCAAPGIETGHIFTETAASHK